MSPRSAPCGPVERYFSMFPGLGTCMSEADNRRLTPRSFWPRLDEPRDQEAEERPGRSLQSESVRTMEPPDEESKDETN